MILIGALLATTAAFQAPVPEVAPATTRTEVAVLGTIHGAHRRSERWGLDELRATIRRIAPDAVLTEIPSDRWERIWKDWTERGVIEDDRLSVFPEYTDVLLPLSTEMGFEIVPCAAWTREMADQRSARIDAFESEAAFEEERLGYARASAAAEAEPPPGPDDDPLVIHSTAYDEWTRRQLAPYDEFLNDVIGPGGWTNINRGHMTLIDRAIDERPGRRLLVTFGSGHKYWFLDRLRERDDVELLDVTPYLPTTEENVNEACLREIGELHRFFEAWFAGSVPDDDETYARFADVLAPDFEIIGPDGVRTRRDALLVKLRAAHGSARGSGMRIWTRNEESRAFDDRHWIATYEEWQEREEGPRGRTSSAVFRRAKDAPNGLEWVHVHETWLAD